MITGGASGLGRSIAEIFGIRGASVAILDVKDVQGGVESLGVGVRWWKCDVGDSEAVRRIGVEIEKDVCRLFHLNLDYNTAFAIYLLRFRRRVVLD